MRENAELAAAVFRIARRDDLQVGVGLPRHAVDHRFEIGRERDAFRAQPFHAGLIEEIERGAMHRHAEHGCVADLPGLGGGHRLELRFHLEALDLVVAPPPGEARQVFGVVFLVHEGTRDRAWTAVQVFVAAPSGEIDVPIVQMHVQVACGVRQVEAGDRPDTMRGLGDDVHLEGLAREEVHAAEVNERQFITQFLDPGFDVLGAQGVFIRTRLHLHQFGLRVQSMPLDLRSHRVGVAREGPLLAEDLRALSLRAIERDEHQVHVHRESVHGHDLGRFRTHEATETFTEELVVRIPRALRLEMAFDTEGGPVVELLLHVLGCRLRLQTEGIPSEIDDR